MKKAFGQSIALVLTATGLVAAGPQFSEKPCPPPLAGTVARCGSVVVAETPGAARTIAINVVVVPASKKSESAVPMFHFEGGPGIAATDAAPFYLGPGSLYRESRDVVLIDQRGTGQSHALHCPALEARSPLVEMYPVADVVACRETLAKDADLRSYSTSRIADDFDAVRAALGYETIEVWAISYGTRLAQEYMRRFPSRVAHAVLAGFVPSDYKPPLFHAANAQRALDLLFYKCQSDADCGARYPHLRSEWASVQQAVRRGVTVRQGDLPVAMKFAPFLEALRTHMGTAAGQRELPAMIHSAAAGNYEPFLASLPKDSSQFALGQYFSIVCTEGAARIAPASIEQYTSGTFLGDYRVQQELGACANWPRHDVDSRFYEPLASSPPILVMSGEMDVVAPPEWGYQFCAALPACRFVLFPDLGHGPFDLDTWTNGACFDEIAAAFYRDTEKVDLSCIRTMHPPKFK